jgi:hypothetical protein
MNLIPRGLCCLCMKRGYQHTAYHPIRIAKKLPAAMRDLVDGWGCQTCGLAPEGAYAVACHRCIEIYNFLYQAGAYAQALAEIKTYIPDAVRGDQRRWPVSDLLEEHRCNIQVHDEREGIQQQTTATFPDRPIAPAGTRVI